MEGEGEKGEREGDFRVSGSFEGDRRLISNDQKTCYVCLDSTRGAERGREGGRE